MGGSRCGGGGGGGEPRPILPGLVHTIDTFSASFCVKAHCGYVRQFVSTPLSLHRIQSSKVKLTGRVVNMRTKIVIAAHTVVGVGWLNIPLPAIHQKFQPQRLPVAVADAPLQG